MAYGLNDAVKEKWSILYASMKARGTIMPLFQFDSKTENENENDLDENEPPPPPGGL